MITISGVNCCRGHALPFGASVLRDGGINFSINSVDAEGCALQLYRLGEAAPFADIRLPDSFRIGSNYAITVYGQDPKELEYTYRFFGKTEPKAGFRFDPDVCLLDPYAKLLTGREIWGQTPQRKVPVRCKIADDAFAWDGDRPLEIPLEDLVIYEMHVRGFTNDPASPAKQKGTFAGLAEMIPYFKALGVNCVELMPVFEFDETDTFPLVPKDERLYNFWGYHPICFFTPKASYACSSNPIDEMKGMILKLHRSGIAVILDVVFNHTGEEGDGHTTISYRGIDNRTWYLLDGNGNNRNLTGCENTVNCNHPLVRQHIVDCLRYWVSEYHVDGFRFDMASILTRDGRGEPMERPPLLEAISTDPLLSKTALIAEAWDAAGLYQVGAFPGTDRWAEWNNLFQRCLRRFVKSDASAGPELIRRIQGSPDLYPDRSIHSFVNYITCHDGFTLNDLVSYNEKHNSANCQENRDGANDNISWNCGAEGPTDDPEIEALRSRQVKNFFALLMLSRGTPMMLGGDEFRNSQCGNNNPYCHDSPLSWVNWTNKARYSDVFSFFQALIRLRREHPVLRRRDYFTGENSSGYPELSFHGEKAWQINMWEPFLTFGFLYAEPKVDFGTKEDCFIYCGVNAHWEEHYLELPRLPKGMRWYLYADSADASGENRALSSDCIRLTPRSLKVLLGK